MHNLWFYEVPVNKCLNDDKESICTCFRNIGFGGYGWGRNGGFQLVHVVTGCHFNVLFYISSPRHTQTHTHHPHNTHSSHQIECLSQFHQNMLYFVSVCDTFESPVLSPVTCRKHPKPRTPSEKSQVVVKAHVSLHNYNFYCQLILLSFFFHKTCSFKHRKKVKCYTSVFPILKRGDNFCLFDFQSL